jgi:hypothetical protein
VVEIDYCFVDERRGLGFIAIPKAGTTSIKKALFGIRSTDVKEIHAEAMVRRMSIRKARAKSIVIFSVVRNPFDRAVSVWRDRVHAPEGHTRMVLRKNDLFQFGMTFGQFADRLQEIGADADIHTIPQAAILVQNGQLMPDFIGRMERIARDWSHLARAFRLPALQRLNAREASDYRSVYGAAERSVVKTLYRDDVRLLGYSFSR